MSGREPSEAEQAFMDLVADAVLRSAIEITKAGGSEHPDLVYQGLAMGSAFFGELADGALHANYRNGECTLEEYQAETARVVGEAAEAAKARMAQIREYLGI